MSATPARMTFCCTSRRFIRPSSRRARSAMSLVSCTRLPRDRAISTKLLITAQLHFSGEGDEDLRSMDFDSLPVPLDRVLLAEEGMAEDLGLGSSVEEDACALLAAAGLDDGEQLSVTLCGDERIRELNKQWRSIDAATDVLSFPMDDEQLLGDLVISMETAQRQATERSCALRDELRVCLRPARGAHAARTLPARTLAAPGVWIGARMTM